jgi:SNF2 family DNA or RNA helicase
MNINFSDEGSSDEDDSVCSLPIRREFLALAAPTGYLDGRAPERDAETDAVASSASNDEDDFFKSGFESVVKGREAEPSDRPSRFRLQSTPRSFGKKQLYDYQLNAAGILASRVTEGQVDGEKMRIPGTILAFEMGLGKTWITIGRHAAHDYHMTLTFLSHDD